MHNWASIMEDLKLEEVVRQAPPSKTQCQQCEAEIIEDIMHVKCDSCFTTFCSTCAEKCHANFPFHHLRVLKEASISK